LQTVWFCIVRDNKSIRSQLLSMKKHIHFPLLHANLVLLFHCHIAMLGSILKETCSHFPTWHLQMPISHRSIVSHKLMNYMATAVYIRI